MKEIRRLCRTIDRLADEKNWEAALAAAVKLWRISRDAEITDRDLRLTYAWTLFKVADLFRHVGNDLYETTRVLRHAYEVGTDEDLVDLSVPSMRENAAYRLGRIYEEGNYHQSAAFWFKRALGLARERPIQDHLLLNLHGVAWNLEPLRRYDEARSCYDEILSLLWPTTERGLLLSRLRYLVPAAMHHLHHGDQALGQSIMRGLLTLVESGREDLPAEVATALHRLGMDDLASGRSDEALTLARLLIARAERFGEDAEQVRFLMHGLVARVFVLRGDFEGALAEIGQVFDLDATEPYGPGDAWLENLELWLDVARIRAHQRDLAGAAAAYEKVAQALGTYTADWRSGVTARLRLVWVRQQADVVHELASVWLGVDDPAVRSALDPTVARALLQLKANLALATEGNRLVAFRNAEGLDKVLFRANRRFAAACRRLVADPEGAEAALDVEDALFAREQLEGRMVAGAFDMIPALARVFHFDFRELQGVEYGQQTLLDYSLVDVRPPSRGLRGDVVGRRYIGVRLSKDSLRVVDLGSEEQVDAISVALVSEVARRPAEPFVASTPEADHAYRELVEPLEPLGKSVVISPEGSLAALPFHALARGGRYLVEALDVVYCHSLLYKESLAQRQRSPGVQFSIDTAGANRDILLLGDPDYSDGSAPPLPGTRVEVEDVADVLLREGWARDDVHRFVGAEATASRLVSLDHPRVLHLAAHGAYRSAPPTTGPGSRPLDREPWRPWDYMLSAMVSDLDQALLRAVLVLSPEDESHDDPAAGRLLTALELSSLNLIACRLAVLSACETGIGQSEQGAGVLGFQYALLASFAHASLVSLWRVPDRKTSELMGAFYRRLIKNKWDVRQAYLKTLRAACRQEDRSVHPYYWAAFVLLDQVHG